MNKFFGPSVVFVIVILLIILVVLWALSIYWAFRDAKARGFNPIIATIISLVPFLGVLAYIMIRPQILLDEKKDIELDKAVKTRLSQKFGICSNCGCPIEEDYLICPKCQSTLRKKCSNCGRPINIDWSACPYCKTPQTFDDSLTSYDIEDIDKEDKKFKEYKNNKQSDVHSEDKNKNDEDKTLQENDSDKDNINQAKHNKDLDTKSENK